MRPYTNSVSIRPTCNDTFLFYSHFHEIFHNKRPAAKDIFGGGTFVMEDLMKMTIKTGKHHYTWAELIPNWYKSFAISAFLYLCHCGLSCDVRYSISQEICTRFFVLCFVVVMQSFIMNSHEVFIHIHQDCFAGTGAIVRLPQCQWSKPGGYGKISQCITTKMHSKAKTVCIFVGIYCTLFSISGNVTGIAFVGEMHTARCHYEENHCSSGSNKLFIMDRKLHEEFFEACEKTTN